MFLLDFCPGGGVLELFFCPSYQGFVISLCPEGGAFSLSKNRPAVCPGRDGQFESQ